MLINSAAHFKVCACGRHGKLITATGQQSAEVCSKVDARRALDEGVPKGTIASFEVGETLRQINASNVAEREREVTLIDHLVVEVFNADLEGKDQFELWPERKQEPPPKYVN